MIVLHYTGMASGEAALARLRDTEAKVSAHYLVEEDGRVFQLVPDARRAWHAGVSFWQGRERLNDVSLGIEIVNPGHAFGYRPFPPAQMEALTGLLDVLVHRHPVPPHGLLAHSDIAPDRKQDPGELFDWRWLHARGFGIWPGEPAPRPVDAGRAADLLGRIGYFPAPLPATASLLAFQRHWLPQALSGALDPLTMGALEAVADACAGAPMPLPSSRA